MYLTTREAAEKYPPSESWFNHARQTGVGPRYLKIGNRVFYRPEDIEEWLERNARSRVWEFDREVAA